MVADDDSMKNVFSLGVNLWCIFIRNHVIWEMFLDTLPICVMLGPNAVTIWFLYPNYVSAWFCLEVRQKRRSDWANYKDSFRFVWCLWLRSPLDWQHSAKDDSETTRQMVQRREGKLRLPKLNKFLHIRARNEATCCGIASPRLEKSEMMFIRKNWKSESRCASSSVRMGKSSVDNFNKINTDQSILSVTMVSREDLHRVGQQFGGYDIPLMLLV